VRLLVASLQSPTPVVDGLSLRLWHLLNELRLRHAVHVVCHGERVDIDGVTSTIVPTPPATSTATRISRGLKSLYSEPALVQEARHGGLLRAVADAQNRQTFDAAHVTPAAAGLVGEVLEAPAVLDAVDAWHLNRAEEARADGFPRSVLRRAASLSIPRFERAALARFPVTTVTSTADREALVSLSTSARVEVVPNGVDADYFAPLPVAGDSSLIAFHGSLGYPPNADAARFLVRDVLPRVTRSLPDARVRLIGRDPTPDVRALASASVDVTGEVPDVRPLLAEAAVVACVVRTGTGIKNKLLEAAALGLPIVATSSAVGDLELVDGEQLLIRDDADSIAGAIVELIADPARAAALATAARAAVVNRWTWSRSAARFEQLYEEIQTG
jgi:polysaccharide biosynthesis protein PslH